MMRHLEQVLFILSEIKANDEIKKVENTIRMMPHGGLTLNNSKFQYFNILGRYKLVYQVKEDILEIRFLLFWDGRRNPDDLQRWLEKF